jgi:hypothetical protein
MDKIVNFCNMKNMMKVTIASHRRAGRRPAKGLYE